MAVDGAHSGKADFSIGHTVPSQRGLVECCQVEARAQLASLDPIAQGLAKPPRTFPGGTERKAEELAASEGRISTCLQLFLFPLRAKAPASVVRWRGHCIKRPGLVGGARPVRCLPSL